MTDKVLT